MDNEHVTKLYDYITKTREYGCNEPWCIGYITAFYNTGLLEYDEYLKILKYITTLYNPFVKTYKYPNMDSNDLT